VPNNNKDALESARQRSCKENRFQFKENQDRGCRSGEAVSRLLTANDKQPVWFRHSKGARHARAFVGVPADNDWRRDVQVALQKIGPREPP
jgi:hypothetical protein